jgi:hypothetical protein
MVDGNGCFFEGGRKGDDTCGKLFVPQMNADERRLKTKELSAFIGANLRLKKWFLSDLPCVDDSLAIPRPTVRCAIVFS